jgi:hypothetical protein
MFNIQTGSARSAYLAHKPDKRDKDMKEYEKLFAEYKHLSLYFAAKPQLYVPVTRTVNGVVEYTVPAFCGSDKTEEEKEEGQEFYLAVWKELVACIDKLAACAYVHARYSATLDDARVTTEYRRLLYAELFPSPPTSGGEERVMYA